MNGNPGQKTGPLQLGSLPALSQIERIKRFTTKFSISGSNLCLELSA